MAVDRIGPAQKIALYEAPDGENEALFIADMIERTLAQNPRERVAVLYRTNFQSRQIEEALRRYGRKYVVVGGFSFYQRAEIKDILAYLKVLVQPARFGQSAADHQSRRRAASVAPPWNRWSNTRSPIT